MGVAQGLDSLQLRYASYATWCAPEKVYLHFDRSCYTAGESIWCRGWVQEASGINAQPSSNYLYVEVLDEQGEAVTRVKIKRKDGAFSGCVELPDVLETGFYTIRAYTLWQLNGSNEYLFNDRIRIIGESGKKKKPLAPSSGIGISFWPEGGRYFADHKAVMGFKVTDKTGRSVGFEGDLVSDIDGVRKRVVTTHDGMGLFTFIPRAGHKYSVRDASGKLYPLPAPAEEGATLQLQPHAGRYYISALGFGGGTASLLVRDATELRPLVQVDLDGKVESFVMEGDFFRPGINHFLLVNARGKILAERLFFIRDAELPVCSLEIEELSSAPRGLIRGVVSLKRPDGTPLDGNCSVSVVRGALKDWQQSEGITSYMGLSSELKGRINNPDYYFNPEIPVEERDAALDVLMVIQGWRYYDLEKILDLHGNRNIVLRHKRERVQEVRGHITRRLSSKMPRDFTFTFMVPEQNIMHSRDVKQGRAFVIDSLDFPENTKMLINIGTSRILSTYLPKWDGDPFAGPHIYNPAPGTSGESMAAEPALSDVAWRDTLRAAVIVADYEDSDALVFGKSSREDLLTYKDMTLVEYLSMKKAMFEYDGEYMYNRNRMKGRFAFEEESEDGFEEDETSDSGRVKLIVGDTEEAWWGYDMLRLEDLRTLSISMQPDPVYGGSGGVVHITVKPGSLHRDQDRSPSLLYFVPLGYQVPRYFESPRYDRGETGPYDGRNTLWWAPDVALEGGRAIIEFCNGDNPDFPYLFRIEGQGADGRPFSIRRSVEYNP